ncbi:MAG: hypothetical protein EXS42_01800 [Lacunisphaera sp.]|nr:hypothetical protein [Lacunisphaera sp.]
MPSTRWLFLGHVILGFAALAAAGKLQAISEATPSGQQTMIAPDLQDGFMIFNYDGVIDKKVNENRWLTPIECVLVRKTAGKSQVQRAYLGHECRAESVGENPFGHHGNYEWVGLSAWDGNYAIRSGPGHANQPVQQYGKMPSDMTIKVACPDRKAKAVSFAEALQMLQSDFKDGYRRLYIAISYRQDGYEYVLYAPSNYINFPHPTKGVRSYLQPISGYVLYEKDGLFFTAYVVSWIERGQTKSLQFKVRDQVSYGETVTHDFNRTVHIDDDRMKVAFFIYE